MAALAVWPEKGMLLSFCGDVRSIDERTLRIRAERMNRTRDTDEDTRRAPCERRHSRWSRMEWIVVLVLGVSSLALVFAAGWVLGRR